MEKEKEIMIECPFNKNHSISTFKIISHIHKCKDGRGKIDKLLKYARPATHLFSFSSSLCPVLLSSLQKKVLNLICLPTTHLLQKIVFQKKFVAFWPFFICAKLLNRNIGRAKQIVFRKSGGKVRTLSGGCV